jgi:hypothetical protein
VLLDRGKISLEIPDLIEIQKEAFKRSALKHIVNLRLAPEY